MEIFREFLARGRRLGFIVLIGLVAIGYISLGLIYWQQASQQYTLTKDIARQNQILARPLASGEQLAADYDRVTGNDSFLASIANETAAFAKIVEIAAKYGIDTSPTAGKLSIPGLSVSEATAGGSKFKLLSFHGIRIQGDDAGVMAFLADIDSGKTLETMVLKQVSIQYIQIPFTAEEMERRAEYAAVREAVRKMMVDNSLSRIPQPVDYAGGRATNMMGDDPATKDIFEGFPDVKTLAIDKGYTGNIYINKILARNGYVLFQHDKINPENSFNFTTVNYFPALSTKYFYTVEPDGSIRQFSGPDAAAATEFRSETGQKTETIAVLNVDIYTSRFDGQ